MVGVKENLPLLANLANLSSLDNWKQSFWTLEIYTGPSLWIIISILMDASGLDMLDIFQVKVWISRPTPGVIISVYSLSTWYCN